MTVTQNAAIPGGGVEPGSQPTVQSAPFASGVRDGTVPPAICTFPNCDCGGQRLYRTAKGIARRIWGDETLYRRVFSTKGLPVFRIGTTLHMLECTYVRWVREMERKSQGKSPPHHEMLADRTSVYPGRGPGKDTRGRR